MAVLTQSSIQQLALNLGMTTGQASIASAIAMAESRGQTDAINPGSRTDPEYSVGLWQINIRAHPSYSVSQMKDPKQNALAMFAISNGGTNWNPWGSYTSGAYKKYLNAIDVSSGSQTFGTTQSTSFTTLSSVVKTNKATLSDVGSGYQYILAYVVAGAIFILMAKSRVGYRALYYGASLLLLLLLVTQSKFIAESLAPLSRNDTSTQTSVV